MGYKETFQKRRQKFVEEYNHSETPQFRHNNKIAIVHTDCCWWFHKLYLKAIDDYAKRETKELDDYKEFMEEKLQELKRLESSVDSSVSSDFVWTNEEVAKSIETTTAALEGVNSSEATAEKIVKWSLEEFLFSRIYKQDSFNATENAFFEAFKLILSQISGIDTITTWHDLYQNTVNKRLNNVEAVDSYYKFHQKYVTDCQLWLSLCASRILTLKRVDQSKPITKEQVAELVTKGYQKFWDEFK